jgi:hypothetical protein
MDVQYKQFYLSKSVSNAFTVKIDCHIFKLFVFAMRKVSYINGRITQWKKIALKVGLFQLS